MEESISREAGADAGEYTLVPEIERLILSMGRIPRESAPRSTARSGDPNRCRPRRPPALRSPRSREAVGSAASRGPGGRRRCRPAAPRDDEPRPRERLTVVVNTGDDDVFHGLHVSPDIDTILYTLSGLADTRRGWGLLNDSFAALAMLGRYGRET